MADIILPKMGDAMEEGRIVQWLKNVGDAVKAGEPVVEIETDKSNVEVEAEESGFLQKINTQPGELAPVGAVIAVIGAEAPSADASSAPAPAPAAEAPKAEPKAAAAPAESGKSNGTGPKVPEETAPKAAPEENPSGASQPVMVTRAEGWKPFDSFVGALPENLGGTASVIGEPIAVSGGSAGSERLKATPVARAMAQANNLDLARLKGSGPDGGIVKADVEAALSSGANFATAPAAASTAPATAPASSVSVSAAEGDEVVEYNAMRRTIARRLTESKQTIPHFYVTSEIDMQAYLDLREQINASAGEGQGKVSVTDMLVKACAVALVENPVVNSVFSDNTRITRKSVNIGVAVAIADGLIVPVVKNCENKSLRAIAKETRPLIERARENKLKPDEYTGGTFTISNLGQYDVENFAAIINPGEAAILAVSSVREVPAVVDGQIVPRKRMKVTLCADHRVMDGVAGAIFLQSLKRVIENPLQILAG
jgi:Pyruvate/2-oxoglutarate dehydrogenase complex, dihydrolipoamide acyltransferase (E2) component, and related enzymes